MAGSANYIATDQIHSPRQMVYYRWISGHHFKLNEQHINRIKVLSLAKREPTKCLAEPRISKQSTSNSYQEEFISPTCSLSGKKSSW